MFYCEKHAKERGWPYPKDKANPFTIPPTSMGPCELCWPDDKTPKLCADVPSRHLPA